MSDSDSDSNSNSSNNSSKISWSVWRHCYEFDWPQNITSIPTGTFDSSMWECWNVYIPPHVTFIDYNAFRMADLCKVFISAPIISIHANAFTDCPFLKEISFSSDIRCLAVINPTCDISSINYKIGTLFDVINTRSPLNANKVNISAPIISIHGNAFTDYPSLKTITFPANMRCLAVINPTTDISSISANIDTLIDQVNTHFPSNANDVYYRFSTSMVSQRLIDFLTDNIIDDAANLVGLHGRAFFGKKRPNWCGCEVIRDNMDGTIKVRWDKVEIDHRIAFTYYLPVKNFRPDKEIECDDVSALYVNWDQWVEHHDGRSPLHGAAEANLCWEELNPILQRDKAAILDVDPKTNMEAFMLAAVGSDSKLESVYALLENHPAAVIPYVG